MPTAFLTDVEGQWERLRSFADGHPGVRLDGDRLTVGDGWRFVFGGDAIDRGPAARRIVRVLLDARRRQPDRVAWLIGNRDLNKIRLRRELDGHPPKGAPTDAARPALLQWIFTHTMGAADAFAHRRDELAANGEPHGDDDVVDSFLADVAPGGDLFAYLDQGVIARRDGGVLFVHGGVTGASVGRVPGRAPSPDLDRWIAALDEFRAEGLDAYRTGRIVDGRPAWADLVAYQAPLPGSKANPTSVIYGRSGDDANHLRRPDDAARRALADAGIDRVVVGHTPTGDTPAIAADAALVLVCADNSRGAHAFGSRVTVDDRGVDIDAWAVVDDAPAHVTARVVPGDGGPVGYEGPDGAQVRGRLDDGRWLLHRMSPGYRSEARAVDALGPLAPPPASS